MSENRPLLSFVLISLLTLANAPLFGEAKKNEESDPLRHLAYRFVGPAGGGRVSQVTGVVGDPLTYYAATAAGGVWKSSNGGLDWKPIFDDQPVSSIGSISVAPSDPNVIYVGSGEANIRGNVGEGNGIYKSTDAGKTWAHVWKQEGQIGAMIVHPKDPDVAFAAALGSPFGPTPERGIYRTTDGGKSWRQMLAKDPDTGGCDLAFHPKNPRTLLAGLWQTRRYPWGMTSGGPGSGLYVSQDGGETWNRLEGKGLPEGIWGKVGARFAPSNPRRLYALIEAEQGGLFRSDDGGETWELVNPSRGLRQRAWYYNTLTVDPHNPEVIWFPQVQMLKTIDGGRSVRAVHDGGWDHHDVWIDPQDPKRMIVGSDSGVSLSRDGGETWSSPPLPISQLYHVSVDNHQPYRLLASLQDYGTASGPSNSLHGDGIPLAAWSSVGGGEAGHVVADPSDPDVVYAGEYLGYVSRYDRKLGRAPHIGINPDNASGRGAAELPYRFQWTAPIVVSPHDPKTLYHAGNVLLRTRDGGQSWQPISPDLTRDDKTKQQWSGGPITGDNTGVEHYGTIFAVAESPLERGTIWAGSDDGLVHVTRDGGASWQKVTPRGLPEWGTVATIEASRWDAATAYVVVDAHRLDDETPYLWKTTDHGASWKSLTAGLDREVYLHVVREDTKRRGMLYLGTERGVMLSLDDGESWRPLRLNLPTVAVHDLVVKDDDLVVGTMGRSAWILDDLTVFRELDADLPPVHLFSPRPAIAWFYTRPPFGSTAGAGANPPAGATFHYHLAKKPEKAIRAEILDAEGRVIDTLSSEPEPQRYGPDDPDWDPGTKIKPDLATEPGIHRAVWDLAWGGAEFLPDVKVDAGNASAGPAVLPGEYTLRLTVDGTVLSRPLRVEADPRSRATPADREAQLALALRIRDHLTMIARMVKTIRALRTQLETREAALAGRTEAAGLVARGEQLAARLTTIEEIIHNPEAEVSYDVLAGRKGGAKLYSRLGWLYEGVKEHEGPPTQGMAEVEAELGRLLAAQKTALDALVASELPALDAQARELGIGYLVAPGV